MLVASLAGAAAVLAAAKLHGRQLRLEREAEGIRDVVFGGANPPFVEALWRADRVRFWALAPLLALAFDAALYALRGPDVALLALAALAWAPSVAFAACAAMSLARAGAKVRDGLAGTAAWTAATTALLGASVALA